MTAVPPNSNQPKSRLSVFTLWKS